MRTFYCLVMDERINPLRALPTAQRFQAMLFLSVMWTTIFCAIAGVWFWYGALVIVHLLLALGVLLTALKFHRANQIATYRDQPCGTALRAATMSGAPEPSDLLYPSSPNSFAAVPPRIAMRSS